jgi:large subunit ribosomal protein L25
MPNRVSCIARLCVPDYHESVSGEPMATRAEIKAERREILGKKVRRLRRVGIMPATVYGHDVRPISIQVNAHEMAGVMRHAGTTQLLDLILNGEPARPVLIRQTTFDAKRNAVTHIEFFQANLREKLVTHVPLHVVGESPAVQEGGIFLQLLDHVDIESLPQDVPEGGIAVDASLITEINGHITAGDLVMPPTVSLVTPLDEIVAKVNPPIVEVEEVLPTEAIELPAEQVGEDEAANAVPEA